MERFKSLGEFVSAALKAQNGGPVDPRLQPAEPEPQGFTESELRQMQGIADQLDEESK